MTTAPEDRTPIDPSAAPRAATSTEPSIDPRLAEGDCTVPLSADVDPSAWPEPVQALAHAPGTGTRPTRLAELTTLRVGGPVGDYVETTSEAGLIDAVRQAGRRLGTAARDRRRVQHPGADAGFEVDLGSRVTHERRPRSPRRGQDVGPAADHEQRYRVGVGLPDGVR